MEMADTLVITKADGTNKEKAEQAKQEYQNALHLFPPSESGWTPRVLCSSAHENRGLGEIWDLIGEYMDLSRKNRYFYNRRAQQSRYWMYEFIHEALRSDFYGHNKILPRLEILEKEVLQGEKSSFHAAMEILDIYRKGLMV
jgi:LAO/AO transport system kinase